MNKRAFIFEYIRRWPVIDLVTLTHGYSYLISLEIVVGDWELKSSTNRGQFKCVLEKHVSIAELSIWDLWSQVAELVQRTATMLKILSGGYQFFQISPRIKFLYNWGRKHIYWP